MNVLKKLWTAPVFLDEEKTRQAYLLHVVVWGLIVMPVPYVLYILLAAPASLAHALLQAGFGEIVNLVLLFMIHRGYVRAASYIQVAAFWIFFAVSSSTGTGGGVRGAAYLLGFPLVIIIAGVLIGGRLPFGITILSLIFGGWMVYAEENNLMTVIPSGQPLVSWILSLVVFPLGAILQDLSAHTVRNALERARASEERYRQISRVSTDYTFATKVHRDGGTSLSWVAGAFERMTGYTYEEYVASGSWLGHLHPDDIEKDARDMEILHKNQDVRSEIRTLAKNGEIRWERVFAHPVWDEKENRLAGIIGAVQDITEQKQAEADREALIRELESKNAELERFTYTASHDLKSPLVTIIGFLRYLEKDAQEGDFNRFRQDLERIEHAANKMHQLLTELLELSRVGWLMKPPVEVSLEAIVKVAIEVVHGQLEAKNVLIDLQDNHVMLKCDRVRIVEVYQNLIDNAIKFMGNQPNPRLEIGAFNNENNEIVFYIRDNGIGIAPDYHENIFGLFNKLHPDSEGTGIGLALVKRIIEVHGGRIWVESQVGMGTTFYFTLPVSKE